MVGGGYVVGNTLVERWRKKKVGVVDVFLNSLVKAWNVVLILTHRT